MFDVGKWAMVPEEAVRKEILCWLRELKNEEKEKTQKSIHIWRDQCVVTFFNGVLVG